MKKCHAFLYYFILQAVRQTGAASVEAAISWVFENRDIGDARLAEEGIYQDFKMIFVVNGSLPMSVGKIAAQVYDTRYYDDLGFDLFCIVLVGCIYYWEMFKAFFDVLFLKDWTCSN